MGLLVNLLTLPVSGPLWVMQRVVEEAERQLYDEDAIRGQLLHLEMLHEAGEIGDDELDAAEEELLERLRRARARRDDL